jgi:hypothetical protein
VPDKVSESDLRKLVAKAEDYAEWFGGDVARYIDG